MAQQAVDDDQLLKQFGLGKPCESQKEDVKGVEVTQFKLDKKPISINWNNELEMPQKMKNKSSLLNEIPTVKTKSTLQM